MCKVSVIIPVYNTEQYIERCLKSLIEQTLSDIEIIVIDDGSTDNSLDLIKKTVEQDTRFKILTQKNAKQGAARNRGLEIAKGEFITFVDSDDWIDIDYLELLYNAAMKNNVNIAAASMTRDYKHKIKNHLKFFEEKVYVGVNEIVKGIDKHLETAGKLYKRELISTLRFEENVLYEDAPYTLKVIYLEQSLVTVPNAHYHYYSNPNSTIKKKLGIKNENDKISTNLQTIDFAKEHNIDIGNWEVLKEKHLLWGIKHYKDYKDYYICGIKVARKNIKFDNSKVFVVFNTACFGDVLLCNSLCKNIKNIFPESKVVFVTDKKFAVVAKYQESVDDVIIYDKKGEHKGLFGLIKFVREFKYKKIFASFITYRNERNYIIAKLLNSRFVKMAKNIETNFTTQEKHNLLLQSLTHKPVVNYPIEYHLPQGINNVLDIDSEYLVLCTTSKNKPKDMPIDMAIELINKINNETNYKVVFVGAGKKVEEYSKQLKNNGCNFIDLVNKTTIPELGVVLKNSKCLVSVDTGTMHYGYSLGVKTLGLFYEGKTSQIWSPKKDIYPNTLVIDKDINVQTIFNAIMEVNK